MRKRLSVFILALSLLLIGTPVSACDENQTNTYATQIVFGDSAAGKASNEGVKKLLSALYLCSEQSNSSGQDKIDYLEKQNVSGIPALSKIDIKDDDLIPCSHNSWEFEYKAEKKAQAKRKKVLEKTVNDVFDFGFWGNLFGSDKCNSFAAMLYYSHILSDYLADDPDETKAVVGEKLVDPYSGHAYITVGGDKPLFTKGDKENTNSFIRYGKLDSLGRAGVVFGNIGPDIINSVGPRDKEAQKKIKPTGLNYKKYPGIVNTTPANLYNRCHLLGHQIGGIEVDENFVTGTRYMNEAMIPFETKVHDYVKKTNHHVLFRATPVFKSDNKVVSGIQVEAYSVEDSGKGICFNVYLYNVQPGIDINYANGENEVSDMTIGAESMIPFALSDASDSNPDLILAMDEHLEILFEDQKDYGLYPSMKGEIKTIANRARSVEKNYDNEAQRYSALKNCEYEYLSVLKNYIPKLLKKEDFFTSAFK